MEDKLFTLLGLGVPFYLAAATYAVFSWLDSNASDEATKVISSWLNGRSHNKPDLGNLIINTFDRIYTSPLLTFRAFRRSAIISAIVWLLVIVGPTILGLVRLRDRVFTTPLYTFIPLAAVLLVYLAVIVLSDYVSLPFVRRFLQLAQTHPVVASVISSMVGLVVVAISFLLLVVGVAATTVLSVNFIVARFIDVTMGKDLLGDIVTAFKDVLGSSTFVGSMRPAFIIHLLLPLFALSSLTARLIFLIFRAVEWAQWFLKQGDAHPLKAIGIVATIIVFGSAMVVKEAWTVL
jgi:hypothetical protein